MQHFGLLCLASVMLFISCSDAEQITINGHMDYVGSSEIYIEKQPIHYKYAPEKLYWLNPDEQGNFNVTIPVDSTEVVFFTIDDQQYPIVAKPGNTLSVSIKRAHFPDSVTLEGYNENWDSLYTKYTAEKKKIMSSVEKELPAFRNGESSDVLQLYKNKIMSARRYLGDTPLDIYYHKSIGEYLVKRLDYIRYKRDNPELNEQEEREAVLGKAKKLNFFAFEVLKHQRAGIRDFTNAYANTFGVEERLEARYDQNLTQYDYKRLGYKTLDSARTSVLKHIDGRKALAYAKMNLIAERIGEMSPEVAEPGYRDFLNEYQDFPEYTSFLRSFYQRVKSVSPGQPAVDFALPNPNGETVRMDDFEGTYVLLDFWAAWCIPCLNEFPHMKELYNKYSRNNFEIVAISIEEDSLTWINALERFENPWIQLYGGNGFDQETFESYQAGGIPFYILINRKGNIERYNDIRPSFNLEAVMDSLLAAENNS